MEILYFVFFDSSLETQYTDKKRKQNFSHTVYKENQMRSGAKSYTRKGFLIYEEMRKLFPYMRRPLVKYDVAPDPPKFPYI